MSIEKGKIFAKPIASIYNQAMATKTKRILPSDAARALGSISTPKKAASSAANGKRRGMLPLEELTCTCGKCPDNPKTYCPRGRAIIRRRDKENPPAWLAERGNMTTTNAIEYSNVAPDTESFAALAAKRQSELRALMLAPEAEREAALRASAPIAAAYYETETGREELADWRAIQGEPFHD
jgi:hypothetical protein